MTPIRITSADLLEARAWSDQVLGNIPDGLQDYAGDFGQAADNYFFGYVGEKAFDTWLVSMRACSRYYVSTVGRSAPTEFIAVVAGVKQRIEVKTASKHFHQFFLIPEKHAITADIFVGARIYQLAPACHVEIAGWLTRAEVERLPIEPWKNGSRARTKPLTQMHPLIELAVMLDDHLKLAAAA